MTKTDPIFGSVFLFRLLFRKDCDKLKTESQTIGEMIMYSYLQKNRITREHFCGCLKKQLNK